MEIIIAVLKEINKNDGLLDNYIVQNSILKYYKYDWPPILSLIECDLKTSIKYRIHFLMYNEYELSLNLITKEVKFLFERSLNIKEENKIHNFPIYKLSKSNLEFIVNEFFNNVLKDMETRTN